MNEKQLIAKLSAGIDCWMEIEPEDRSDILEAVKRILDEASPALAALTPQQDRWLETGKAVERACEELPEGVDLHLELERGAGSACLHLPDDDGPGLHDWGVSLFADQINAAIDHAIEQAGS